MLNERLTRMEREIFQYDSCDYGRTARASATEAYQKFAGEDPTCLAAPKIRKVAYNGAYERLTDYGGRADRRYGQTNEYRGANLLPEYTSSSWLIADIDEFPVEKDGPLPHQPRGPGDDP